MCASCACDAFVQDRAIEYAGFDAMAETDLSRFFHQASVKRALMPFATMMRFTAMQIWPMLEKDRRAAATAASIGSASSRTMKGHWPPSSSSMRFRLPADARMMDWPAGH